ncbi:MAG: DUF1343 domain-containing protein [Desulfobacterales bacterium]|nr:DUF1343 domain-containing protein [Desulfobacterales bacterium]
METKVRTGLENLIKDPPEYFENQRLGLLCNPASVSSDLTHASGLIDTAFPGQLKALFSPQHGYYAQKQDNMIESDHAVEPHLNIPVYSLYGETRIPTEQMFDTIDILLVDIQDVGTRVYTFIYTVSYCMETASHLGKKIVILDRPNPVSGARVEGNLLTKEVSSFVGRYEIPMRHGLTIAEIMDFFNHRYEIGCDLEIIPMTGWRRKMYWQDTKLAWVAPSPNLPTPESALVYPGQVIFEGTNVSEGRGTTQPFELFGAPYIDCDRILEDTRGKLPGIHLRPVCFEPTSGKWKETPCHGFQIHVMSKEAYEPYESSLVLMQSILKHSGKRFEYKRPPYEYEYNKMPIDLIIGDPSIRNRIDTLEEISSIRRSWRKKLNGFKRISEAFYRYG